jgi:uncharacterized membrane protein
MATQVTKTVIVKGAVNDIYELWADFENFPHFMEYVKAVESTGENTSHWVLQGPAGMNIDWNAEMTRAEENKRIAWSSKDGKGFVTTSGQVTFNSLPNEQVEVTAVVNYDAPAGKVGDVVASLFANPEKRLATDMRNFKQYAEKKLATT